jgi:glycosyltransferase involved in cell wall biosynthesis
MISFIIPAHNEEHWLGRSISAIRRALETVKEPYEIIVVDDASTDGTVAVAEAHGVRLARVARRQIAATRNSGARAAKGDIFFFVDADTLATQEAIQAGLQAMQEGAVGGGCMFAFEEALPLWARVLHAGALLLSRPLGTVGGCFLFCTREAYEAAVLARDLAAADLGGGQKGSATPFCILAFLSMLRKHKSAFGGMYAPPCLSVASRS